jgi:hypothetical protein
VHITHSYIGATQGNFRCQFFLLYQDYIEAESLFAKQFEGELERFAHSLGQEGVLVKPFLGDIESTKTHVLNKRWSDAQRSELSKTPSLLMIDTDFDSFDPEKNRWVLFSFGSGALRTIATDAAQLRALFQQISTAVQEHAVDPFDVALSAIRNATLKQGGEVFALRPGMFGVSVDLRAVGRKLKGMYRHSQGSGRDV